MIEVTKTEKDFFKKVQPLEKRVIVKRDLFSKSGIIMKEGQGKYRPQGTLVAVGPECTVLKVGDKVGWSSTTMCEVLYFNELKDEKDTEGNYISTVETYLAYKLK